jgi:hypothetical protein
MLIRGAVVTSELFPVQPDFPGKPSLKDSINAGKYGELSGNRHSGQFFFLKWSILLFPASGGHKFP